MDNIHDISSYKPCKNSKNYSVKELWHTPHALTLLFFGLIKKTIYRTHKRGHTNEHH